MTFVLIVTWQGRRTLVVTEVPEWVVERITGKAEEKDVADWAFQQDAKLEWGE